MSFKSNKASALPAIITLMAACAISISAQTPGAVNSLTAKPESIRETKETVRERKAVPAKGIELTTGSEVAKVRSRDEDSESLRTDDDATVTAGVANKGRGPIVSTTTTSPQTTSPDKWEFQVSPYFWLASLHGTGGVGNRTAQVDMSFSDIFGALKFALMGTFEARKGKFVLLTDLEYVSIEDDKATPGPLFSNVNARFSTFIFNPEMGYRVFANPEKGQFVDVLGGIRVWHVNTDLDFGAGILPATQVQGSRNWVDGIAGLRGRAALSPKVFVTGKVDLGGGGSDFTWHLFAGGGYNVNPKVALIFGYRVLDVKYNKDNFIYDMNQRGPIMGLGFKF